jgi:hypothetical protein
MVRCERLNRLARARLIFSRLASVLRRAALSRSVTINPLETFPNRAASSGSVRCSRSTLGISFMISSFWGRLRPSKPFWPSRKAPVVEAAPVRAGTTCRTAAVIGKAGAITAEAKAHGRQGKERGYTDSRTHRQEPVLGLDPDGAVVYEYVSTRDFTTLP